jgi:hypothetical protein
MKGKLLIVFIGLWAANAQAQEIGKAELKMLQKMEDSIKKNARAIVMGKTLKERMRADSQFIRGLVRALKVPNSFYYSFDSCTTISRLYAPDNSFRIFTWQLMKDEDFYLQQGAIQMNMPDGSLKLFPLHDVSQFQAGKKILDSVRGRTNWVGAVYYKIILKEYEGKKYYTLLGFDNDRVRTDRKWIEVLSFDETGQPKFGGELFNMGNSLTKGRKPVQNRYLLEFKKDGNAKVGYDPEEGIIYFDHLSAEKNDNDDSLSTYVLVPDGDFEGFKWQGGQWQYISQLGGGIKLKDGQFPVENPLMSDDGSVDEAKLTEISRKNMEKEAADKNKQTEAPKANPKKGKKGE